MAFLKSKKSKKSYKRKSTRSSRSTRPSRKGMIRLIKSVARGQQETKRHGVVGDFVAYNNVASSAGDIYEVFPDISSGSADTQRVGNTITLTKHQVKGTLKIVNTGTIDYVTVWFVEDKWMKNPNNVSILDCFNVLRNVAQVPTNPTGAWEEVGYGLNTERFIIKRKIIKMGMSPITFQSPSDSYTHAIRHFTFTRTFKRGRKLKYQSEADVQPNNYNTYMFVSFQRLDASLATTNVDITLQATSTVSYKDA